MVALHLASHPDDEVLGAPATLMALRDSGWRVINVCCSLGRPAQEVRRRGELTESCRLAGFELRVPDPPLRISSGDDRAAARAALLRLVAAELDSSRPQLVFSPSPHDRHPAHELVGSAVRDVLAHRGGDLRWWMWGLWASLPFPTLGVPFDAARLEEIVGVLSAHRGELERNDYRRLLAGRAEMNAAVGPELIFGFGTEAPAGCAYLELLTEVAFADGCWRLGCPRWLDPREPLGGISDVSADAWLGAPGLSELLDRP